MTDEANPLNLPPAAVLRKTMSNITKKSGGGSSNHRNHNHGITHFELYGDGQRGKVIGLDPNREPPVKLTKFVNTHHVDPRPGWSMVTPASPAANEVLQRRREFAAFLAPNGPAHSFPIPYEERKRHISPVAGRLMMINQQRQGKSKTPVATTSSSSSNPYFPSSKSKNDPIFGTGEKWQLCYSVQ
jgi:hypothetical protein